MTVVFLAVHLTQEAACDPNRLANGNIGYYVI
jgi:hypothetical protein